MIRPSLVSGWTRLSVLALVVGGFAVALWPEPRARVLTPATGWKKTSAIGEMAPRSFGPQWQQVRNSIRENAGAVVFRNYRAETGTQPGSVSSGPFHAAGLVSVLVAGYAQNPNGSVHTFISCSLNDERLSIERGGVNTHIDEALVRIAESWCEGDLRLTQTSDNGSELAGVGSVSALSPISGLKQSFIGLLPYLLLSLAAYALIALAGALALRRWLDPMLGAAIALGMVFLGVFFVYALAPPAVSVWSSGAIAAVALVGILTASKGTRRSTLAALAPYAAVWGAVSIAAAALLTVAYNGNGHWEPNYRFQPAGWSSDFELPWMFAEALRKHYDLDSLFGGWRPTDRPPLMTGGHLLVSELFGLMQSVGNDGEYLRGMAFNMSAIAMNALWAPTFFYFLGTTLGLSKRHALSLVLLSSIVPFFLFNTIYGWPKLLGGAYGLLATAAAIAVVRGDSNVTAVGGAVAFGAAAALSVMAHASNAFFLIVVAVFVFWGRLKREPLALATGVSAGILLMAPWLLYQRWIAPSSDPLLKYALAGDFGFGAPHKTALDWVVERYSTMTFSHWIAIKLKLAVSPFLPIVIGIGDVTPPRWVAPAILGGLRQWDFFYLSLGNAILWFGFILLLKSSANRGIFASETLSRARLVCGLTLASFLLIVLMFFTTLVVHQLPYSLIMTMGAASVTVLSVYRRAFRWVSGVVLAYVIAVWIATPLVGALQIDWLACLVLMFLAMVAVLNLRPDSDHRPTPA